MLNILKDPKFTELLDASNIQTSCSASLNWVDSGCYERKRGKVGEEWSSIKLLFLAVNFKLHPIKKNHYNWFPFKKLYSEVQNTMHFPF